jgi:hypothetical protein
MTRLQSQLASLVIQGAQGRQGSVGAQGVQGATGAQGAVGAQGVQGVVGSQGAQGATGPQGTVGAQGVQGATGPQGVQGAVGAQGVQGAVGAQGVQGATGPQGVQGATPAVGGSNTQVQFNNSGALGGSANFVFDGTNVGIGTASPNALLEVYGGDIRIRSTSNGANGFLTFVNTSNVVASSIYNYNGLLSLNEQLIITNSTGNVGIGVTPGGATRLSVTASSGSLATFTQTGATGYGLTIVPGADTTYDAFTINNAANSLNQIRMFGNGNATFAGSVGIGTSSPNANLQVTSSAFPVLKVADELGGGAVALGDSTITSNYVGIWRGAANSISGGGFLNVQGNGIAFMSTDNVFGSATRTMTLDNGGKLLVGTTNSQDAFVNGSTQAVFRAIFSKDNSSTAFDSVISQLAIDNMNTTTNNYSQLAFTTSDGANRVVTAGIYAQITARSSANWTTSNLQFYTGTVGGPPTEKMRITNAGNVGIGTSSPGSLFTVSNSNATAYLSTNTLTSGQWARISNPSATADAAATLMFEAAGAPGGNGLATISGVATAVGSMAITFGTRNSSSSVEERMRITSDGSVAITQTPGKYTIDVTGGATSIANGGTVDFPSASGMLIVNNHTDGQVTIYVCGGGTVANIGGTGAAIGSFVYNAGIAGYRWTSTYGSASVYGFFFVRTRNTA